MTYLDVCAFDDLAVDRATKFLVEGRPVAVVRIGDEVYAIGDRCSHANISLSEGQVNCAARSLECWKHGSEFSLVTGKPSAPPATRSVPVYNVVVAAGRVKLRLR